MNDEWGTPLDLFDSLNKEYKFVLDAAATKENALCKNFYTKEDNALEQSWEKWQGMIWLNPPYSRGLINEFIDKVIIEYNLGAEIIMLTRLDPSTKWFKKIYSYTNMLTFLPKRLRFRGAKTSYPFPCCLSFWTLNNNDYEIMYWNY